MIYKALIALLAVSMALVVGVLLATAVYGQAYADRDPHSYDELLDMGYGIIKYQGHTLLVKPEFAKTYLNVANCESGYDQKAEGALGERGLMQINPVHIERIERLGFDWDGMYTGWKTIAVAYDIWSESESWDAWSCQP